MSISSENIKFYKSTNSNDTAGNGGLISSNVIINNTVNNLFPDVTPSERVDGKIRDRKFFMRNENVDNLSLRLTELWISARSTGDDCYQIKQGSDVDIQSDVDGYVDWHGAGLLAVTVGSGETQIEVTYDTDSGVFSGENLFIKINDGANEAKVQVVGTPTWIGNTATIVISGELGYNFAMTDTVVSTIMDLGDVEKSFNFWAELSVDGEYDESTYPVELYNVGTISESWTILFEDSENFSVSGAITGSLGSGDINTDFQPGNDNSYYFKISKDGFSGLWISGESITFNTTHAGQGLWAKEIVPAGIGSMSGNVVTLNWAGASA